MRERDYLYYDVECSDGHHICSFGYVLVDKDFNIKYKDDIVINPQWRFKLGRDGFDPRIHLAYTVDYFKKQPTFDHFYEDIKKLLTMENRVILGHSITADVQYLNIACERYGKDKIEFVAYDTQKFYHNFNNKYRSRSLENIIADLDIDVSSLTGHKSCDDAEMSMLVAKEIAKRMECDIEDLLNLCDNSTVDGKPRPKSERAKGRSFDRKLKEICQKFPNRAEKEAICLSDSFVEKSSQRRLNLIKLIFEKGYNYTNKVSASKYFVSNGTPSKREESFEHNLQTHPEMKKITISELSEMLGEQIDDNCEFGEEKLVEKKEKKTKDWIDKTPEITLENSPFYEQIVKELEKKGLTYEEYIKSILN